MKEKATALLGQLHGLFDQHAKELEEAKTDLAKRTESFQQEQKLMQTKPVADNDIVNINVGGTLLSTKRSTLTQAEGSTLAAMFSGRWEQCLDHDAEGRVFLDFDPYCFQQILFCLRAHNIRSKPASAVVLPHMDPSKKAAYNDLVRYLTLEDYLCSCTVTTALTMRLQKPGPEACITLEGRRVKVLSGKHDRSVLVDPCIQGVAYMKCKLHCAGQWMFVGIGQGLDNADESTYSHPATYGWSSGNKEGQYIKGKSNGQPATQLTTGDWLLLRCDTQSNILSLLTPKLVTPSHIQFDSCIPGQYVFHLNVYETGTEVELLPVSLEEQRLFDV